MTTKNGPRRSLAGGIFVLRITQSERFSFVPTLITNLFLAVLINISIYICLNTIMPSGTNGGRIDAMTAKLALLINTK